jgi:hypothetical protein
MAVAAASQEPLKSMPDRSKLAGMASRTVQVARMLAPGRPAQTIIPALKSATMEQIDDLPAMLANTWGPGTYKIEVYDDSGSEKDSWTAKLGGPVNGANDQEGSMNGSNGANGAAMTAGILPDGSAAPAALRPLGHGYFYDEALGVITTPNKQMFPWRQGDPFPAGLGPVTAPAQGASSAWNPQWGAPPPWTPQGQQPPWATGWGSFPVEQPNRELELLKERLAAAEKQAERSAAEAKEARDREERRTEREATEARFKALADAQTAQTQALLAALAKLGEAPKGPDPQVEALRLELAESKRQAEVQRADAERRASEERTRAEIAGMNTRFEAALREAAGNKTDPMVTVLMQLMTSQQASSTEAVRMIGESSKAQLEAARLQAASIADKLATGTMTPERMIELVRTMSQTSQGTTGEMQKGFAQLFTMATELIKFRTEMESAGAPPAWQAFAERGMEQLGNVAKMIAAMKMRAQMGPQQPQQGQGRPPQQVQARPAAPPQQRVAAPAPRPAVMPPPPPAEEHPADIRERLAAEKFGPRGADGRPIGRQVPPAAAPAPAPAAAATPNLTVVPPPAAAAPEQQRGGRKGGSKRREVPAPAPQAPPAAAAAEVANRLPTPEEIEAAAAHAKPLSMHTPDEVRASLSGLTEEDVFGPAMSQVKVLRASVREMRLPAHEVANAMLEARGYFQGFGIYPPCLELLDGGHIDILVEWLLPEENDAFRGKVVTEIRTKIAAAMQGAPPGAAAEADGEEEEGEEEEDGGDEGQAS